MSHRPFVSLVPVAFVAAAAAAALSCFSRGSIHSYRTEAGRPLAEPVAGDAYLVWHDGGGWHLRARSDVGHVFEGEVEGGGPRSVTPVGLEPDAFRADGRAIAFSFVPGPETGEAGFDWQGGCADFSLYVSGDTHPLLVYAGAYGANPPRIPFSLCP